MRIEYLADHLSKLTELARLHFAEWSYLHPGESLEERIERLKSCCGRHAIPSVVVALKDDDVMGSAALIERDMDTRPDLKPWLAGVYVKKQYRGRHVGRALVKRIEEEAQELSVRKLYLYTPGAEGLYKLLGWDEVERCEYQGTGVVIMSKRLYT